MKNVSVLLWGGALLSVVMYGVWVAPSSPPERPVAHELPTPLSYPILRAEPLPAPPQPIPQAKEPAKLSDQVDALLATRSPDDAYTAYLIAFRCVGLRRDEPQRVAEEGPALCGDLTPGQISSRLAWLEEAAQAAVPGAAMAYMTELAVGDLGPRGEPDPTMLARAWGYLQLAASHGDKHALLALSDHAESTGDMAHALMYWVAMNEREKAATGKDTSGFDAITARLRRSLTEAEAASATAAGQQLATRSTSK